MLPNAPTTPTDASGARVLTWLEADRLSPHDVIDRWRNHESAALYLDEPEHHLEELALMFVAAEWLTRWQPISVHRAILAGDIGPSLRCRWDGRPRRVRALAEVGRHSTARHDRRPTGRGRRGVRRGAGAVRRNLPGSAQVQGRYFARGTSRAPALGVLCRRTASGRPLPTTRARWPVRLGPT
jgi:hypothetical protein